MDAPSPAAHPFRAWRLTNNLDLAGAVERLEAVGRKTSAAYLQQIENAHRRPRWEFAKDMAQISGLAVEQIMDYQRDAAPESPASEPSSTPDATA